MQIHELAKLAFIKVRESGFVIHKEDVQLRSGVQKSLIF